MTIARRGSLNLDPAISTPLVDRSSPVALPAGRPMSAPPGSRGDVPAPDASTPLGRLRRCVFRRIDPVTPLPQRRARPTYEVTCLYGDGTSAIFLGDVATARPICEACTAPGIFRPDEA